MIEAGVAIVAKSLLILKKALKKNLLKKEEDFQVEDKISETSFSSINWTFSNLFILQNL